MKKPERIICLVCELPVKGDFKKHYETRHPYSKQMIEQLNPIRIMVRRKERWVWRRDKIPGEWHAIGVPEDFWLRHTPEWVQKKYGIQIK